MYRTAIDLKVPPNIIVEFARIYGFQVDFQRDIRRNDNFQIMYEVFEDDNGKIFETGNIIFANLKLSGVNNSLYYFDKKGSEGHYNKNGKSVKKALMKTPINGARLSSAFSEESMPVALGQSLQKLGVILQKEAARSILRRASVDKRLELELDPGVGI